MLAPSKRFIAGAQCPSCQATDTLAIWRVEHQQYVACVQCDYQQQHSETPARKQQEKIISLLRPE